MIFRYSCNFVCLWVAFLLSAAACSDENAAAGLAGLAPESSTGAAAASPGASNPVGAVCGDGVIGDGEQCDDGNDLPADGCGSSCRVEGGFECTEPGVACAAAICGNGVLGGGEQCDDGNLLGGGQLVDGDGCNSVCELEVGFKCDVPGQPCSPTRCGDMVVEGLEQCDDGNKDYFDGCDPVCRRELNCTGGVCVAECGDGLKLPQEACDDGNVFGGDGCSARCELETGFACVDSSADPPATLALPVVIRDFSPWDCRVENNNSNCSFAGAHPDFQTFSGSGATQGLVEVQLGPGGRPVYTGVAQGSQMTSAQSFSEWYQDVDGVNLSFVREIPLTRNPSGAYEFLDASFFPISDVGWPQVAATPPPENLRNGGKNFYFTTVTRVFFEYQPGQSLNFSGDDDVWVFVDGRLVLDIGGLHPEVADSFTLNGATTDRSGAPLNLNEGGIYDLVLFHAERRTGQSNFNLTLNNFEAPLTRCTTICGDGIKTPQEQCDDGNLIDDDDCSNDCMRKDLQGGLI